MVWVVWDGVGWSWGEVGWSGVVTGSMGRGGVCG